MGGKGEDFVPQRKNGEEIVSAHLQLRDCAIITWRGSGLENKKGGIGENINKREGGWMQNLIHTGEALLFLSFLQTGKVVEELLEFKYKY